MENNKDTKYSSAKICPICVGQRAIKVKNVTQINTDATDLPREILQSRNPEISELSHRVNTD